MRTFDPGLIVLPGFADRLWTGKLRVNQVAGLIRQEKRIGTDRNRSELSLGPFRHHEGLGSLRRVDHGLVETDGEWSGQLAPYHLVIRAFVWMVVIDDRIVIV